MEHSACPDHRTSNLRIHPHRLPPRRPASPPPWPSCLPATQIALAQVSALIAYSNLRPKPDTGTQDQSISSLRILSFHPRRLSTKSDRSRSNRKTRATLPRTVSRSEEQYPNHEIGSSTAPQIATVPLNPQLRRLLFVIQRRQDVGRSVVIPLRRPHKCRQPLSPGLLHHHVQRSRMVRSLCAFHPHRLVVARGPAQKLPCLQ